MSSKPSRRPPLAALDMLLGLETTLALCSTRCACTRWDGSRISYLAHAHCVGELAVDPAGLAGLC
jgi:hypothetical protein